MARIFGEIPGNPPGTTYDDRDELAASGVHPPTQAGISGGEREGADSIVVSGGYEDDEDYGSLIVYTGSGGRDTRTGRQIADQEFRGRNLALVKSEAEGLPIRVVRGAGGEPALSPSAGYRYDGLFSVERSWREPGKAGFLVCRYRLRELARDGTPLPAPAALSVPTPRAETTLQRIVRNSEMSRRVKKLHNWTCQVCGIRVAIPSDAYAEGAHIRPLGRPHDGPDAAGNLLCLCPNDHVRFEFGAIVVEDDLTITDRMHGTSIGTLRVVPEHHVDPAELKYHRERFDLFPRKRGEPRRPKE